MCKLLLKYLFEEYLEWVWKMDENCNESDFWTYIDDFKFSAVNNFDSGFNFADWLLGKMVDYPEIYPKVKYLNDLLTFEDTCEVINEIQNYYRNNAVEELTNFIPEIVILNWAYVYLEGMSTDDMLKLLGVEIPDDIEEVYIKKI